jgi:hypothetical protein
VALFAPDNAGITEHAPAYITTGLGKYTVSEISEVTINKCHKKLESMKEQLIPQVVLDKYKDTF